MIDNLLLGFQTVFEINNLLFLIAGCLLGTAIGILPGIGTVICLSILLPFTYGFDPITSIILMAGIYYGAQYGGSNTSILLNVPGEPSTVMTCIDGYPMAQQGRASEAIISAGIGSFVAGIFAVFAIAFAAPALSDIAFEFGPTEFASLMLLGIISISVITSENLVTGLGMACIGMLLGTVGTDINSATERFTLNQLELVDGITVGALVIGVLGLPALVTHLLDKNLENKPMEFKLRFSFQDLKRVIPSILRGTGVGTVMGVIPGGGAVMSAFAAYVVEKKVSKNKQDFGKGAIEGVAAPESANNAASQTSLIPLLTLGIPENPVMALILSSLIINGVQPGPGTVTEYPELFWGLLASMLLGNMFLLFLNIPFVKMWMKIISYSKSILYPLLISIALVGVYFIKESWFDVGTAIFFTLLGIIFIFCKLESAPLIFGYIIGPLFEENLRRTLTISDGSFIKFMDSNISLFFLSISAMFILWGIIRKFNYLHHQLTK